MPNQPPTLSNVATLASFTEEGGAVTLSGTVSVSDPDNTALSSATVQITGGAFSGDGDVLAANPSSTSITVSYNSSTETLTLTGTDTLADYESVLDNVTFNAGENPTDYGSNATRTVVWTLNDGSTSSTAVTTAVNVTNVNDPPTLSNVPSIAQFDEESSIFLAPRPTWQFPGVSVTDSDNLNLVSATVQIAGGTFTGDGDVLSESLAFPSISTSYNSATETLTLTGTDTLLDYEVAIQNIVFHSTSENPTNYGSNPTRTVVWTLNDGGGSNNVSTATETITIFPFNNLPTIALGTTVASWTGGQAASLAPAVTVSDPDSLGLASATVLLTGGTFAGDGDVLAATAIGNITVSYNSTTETLILTGGETLANYQTVLNSVTFRAGDNPTNFGSNPTRTAVWTVNDGTVSSAVATSTINLTNVSEPSTLSPTLSNVDPIFSYTEDGSFFALSPNVKITDPDNLTLVGATVRIVGGTFAGDGDLLGTAGTSSISASYNSSTETLTLTGTDTLANYQFALDTITFRSGDNPTNFGSNSTRTVTWLLDDGGDSFNLSTAVTSAISITAINDSPTLASVVGVTSYTQNAAPITVSPSMSVSDPDNLKLANATVSIANGFPGDGDVLAVSTTGTGITASYNSLTETLTLTGSDTLAHYSQVLDSVTFAAGSNPTNSGSNSTRTLSWVVNDGGASNSLSAPATTTISIAPQVRNDVNADGKSDMLLQNTNGTPQIWVMNGTSVMSMTSLANSGPSWHVEATGDFNADGTADILWQNDDGLPFIWEMNGSTIIGAGALPNSGPTWHIIATGDFNGDGKADIVWQNNDGLPVIWEMNGTSIMAGAVLPNSGPSWRVIGTGDFNGDGKADIIWQNTDGLPFIWEMNGTSIIGAGALPNSGPSWHVIGTGDFNGDGKADILWQNTDGLPVIWEMNGTSIIGGAVLPNSGPSWHAIGTSDFNGDGKSDIIWQNTDGLPFIWEMNGTSVIGAGALPNQGPAWQIKNDGPIPPDQMGTAAAASLPAPGGALHLSAPDLSVGSADPTAPHAFGNSLPLIGRT